MIGNEIILNMYLNEEVIFFIIYIELKCME